MKTLLEFLQLNEEVKTLQTEYGEYIRNRAMKLHGWTGGFDGYRITEITYNDATKEIDVLVIDYYDGENVTVSIGYEQLIMSDLDFDIEVVRVQHAYEQELERVKRENEETKKKDKEIAERKLLEELKQKYE